TFPLPFELWAKKMKEGTHLITPSIRQLPAECVDPHIKNRSRIHYYLAEKDIHQHDPDAFALLLDGEGFVTETATANFFIVKGGTIVSPRADRILLGISRDKLIELARRLDIPFAERDIPISEAARADEAFLTSTPYCLMPVTRINQRSIGTGIGPIYSKLLE